VRTFKLHRKQDVSGISGEGNVADAVEFAGGKVVVSWLKPPYGLSIHDSLEAAINAHGHRGKTEFLQTAVLNS
jgi:hypothetical protein